MNTLLDRIYISLLKRIRPYDAQGAQLWRSRHELRNEILDYYRAHPTDDAELNNALAYLRKRADVVYFPARFREKYKAADVHIQVDADGTPYWDMPDGKRLFFLPDEPINVSRSINGLRIEQDKESPHCYLTPAFNLNSEDILADVGSAEGILALQYIDRVKKVYLFESDPAWVSVLQKTFAPWAEKVTIVSKFVGDKDADNQIRLDTYFQQEGVTPTFVKMDVEGAELSVLNGMQGLLDAKPQMKIAACTYHLRDEYEQVTAFARSKGYRYETSRNWMFFNLYDECRAPYFRRGLVRMWVNQ